MHTLLKQAPAKANYQYNDKGSVEKVIVTIADEFHHTFDGCSRITKYANRAPESEMNARFDRGSFFIVDGKLIDYRESDYTGFIHSDANIAALIKHIGLSVQKNKSHFKINTPSTTLMYQQHSSKQLVVFDGPGGVYDTNIGFAWSPFRNYVSGVLELIRLICANGMVTTDEFFSSKVPLINKWQDNLEVAAKLIQLKADQKIVNRLEHMAGERCDINTLSAISRHAHMRLVDAEFQNADQRALLANIAELADPMIHCAGNYSDTAFSSSVGKNLPGHMTVLDAYNMITEISTHTANSETSSARAIQMLANNMMFKGDVRVNAHIGDVKLSPFSNANQAFFGELAVA